MANRTRTFGINILLLFAINGMVKPVYLLGIDRGVQNAVGASEYGLYAVLFNFVFIFQIFADLGLQNFSQQWVARQRGSVVSTLSRTLSLKWMLSFVFIAVVVTLGWLGGYLGKSPLLLIILMVNMLLTSWVLYLRTTLSGLGYYRTDSLFSSLDKLLMILIMGYFLLFQQQDVSIELFALSQTVALVIALLLLGFWIRSKVKGVRVKLQRARLAVILRKALPYALIVFLMTIFTRVDVLMVEWLSEDGLYQSGTYVASVRLLDAANIAGFLTAGLLLPMFSNASREQKPPVELARASWHFLMAIALTVGGLCWFYGEWIAGLLYDEATPMWGSILSILMLTFVVRSSDYVFGSLLTAYERLRLLNIVYIGGVLLNVGLNLWLVPRYEALGAAYATLISQGGVALVFFILSHRSILKSGMGATIARPLGMAGMLVIFGFILSYLEFSSALSVILFGGFALLISLGLGLFRSFAGLIFSKKGHP